MSGKLLLAIFCKPNKWAYTNVLQALNGAELTVGSTFLDLLDLCETNVEELEEQKNLDNLMNVVNFKDAEFYKLLSTLYHRYSKADIPSGYVTVSNFVKMLCTMKDDPRRF